MQHIAPLVRRVLVTLGYVDQFQYPLTMQEIWSRLIALRCVSRSLVVQAIQVAQQQGLIRAEQRGGKVFYSLANRYGLSAQRIARAHWSEQKITELQPLIRLVRLLPWIEAMAVTGSVAMNNAQLADDTDILIVTKPGSLWLMRPLLIWFAWWHGKRRTWRKEEPNSWCFNLWLESDQLAMPRNRRSLYTAHEVLQARWCYDRSMIQAQFLQANAWVRTVIPVGFHAAVTELSQPQQHIGRLLVDVIVWISSPVWRLINYCVYLLQLWYMRPHRTREIVRLTAAFFHPRDTRQSIYQGWRAALASGLPPATDVVEQMQYATELPVRVRRQLATVKQTKGGVVLATGVFDMLHQEHVIFLQKAAQLGDFLLVGVESDARVRSLKGSGRPVFTAVIRARQVAAIPGVSAVVVLPEGFSRPADHAAFLQLVQPQFLAVSASSAHLDKKQAAVAAVGGELVVVHEHNSAVSSTQLLAEQGSQVGI